MPDNYIHLGLLATLFPNAVFIHCRRDLRDVAVSCWMTGFRSVRWTNDTQQIATAISAVRPPDEALAGGLARNDSRRRLRGNRRRPRGRCQAPLRACGLEWEPACLEFHRNTRPIHTASFSQVREPVYRSSLGRWKNYETELADLFAALPK